MWILHNPIIRKRLSTVIVIQQEKLEIFMNKAGWTLIIIWLVRLTVLSTIYWQWLDLLIIFAFGTVVAYKIRAKRNQQAIVTLIPLKNNYGVFQVLLQAGDNACSSWAGRSLADLNLRKKDLLVLAINRGQEMLPFPKGPEILALGDELLVFGCFNELFLNISKNAYGNIPNTL
jgi:hypothetical protein